MFNVKMKHNQRVCARESENMLQNQGRKFEYTPKKYQQIQMYSFHWTIFCNY